MPPAASPPLFSAVAAVVVAAAAAAGIVLARGSTAVPAAGWAAAAAAAYAAESWSRASGGLGDPAAAAAVRLAVVALSLCPIMSLLGAKRPQYGVWQFIVATLAAVLAMPAASAALVRPGSLPDVHVIERWLVLVLLLVAGMNFIATRHGVAASLVVAGQLLLSRCFLPFGDMATSTTSSAALIDAVGAGLVAAGAILAVVQSWWWPIRGRAGCGRVSGRSAEPVDDPAAVIDAGFLPLRETLGAAWTLRISERFNAEAEARGWPCRLRFDGLHVDRGPLEGGWQADAIRTARALLRRFVSPAWLARHRRACKNR